MGAAAIAGMGMQAAGGILGAYGSIQSGNANQRLAEREADVLEYRASLAEEQGKFGAESVRKQGKAIQGAQKTGYASQGVVVGDGSSGQVLEQTAKLSEQDALQIKLNAAREAWGMREQAKVTRYQGDLAKLKGRLDAIGGLLGTGGSVASQLANMKGGDSPPKKRRIREEEEVPRPKKTYESTGMAIFPMAGKPKSFIETYKSFGGI